MLLDLVYETEAMSRLRSRMYAAGFSEQEFENFKAVLIQLECMGFRLSGPCWEEV